MNYALFIPSNGIGEIYLDILDMHWYIYNSSCFNLYKEIPFFKLLLDMASLRMRYYMPINSNRLLVLQTFLFDFSLMMNTNIKDVRNIIRISLFSMKKCYQNNTHKLQDFF